MMWLMLAQWVACVVLALTVSPLTWIGSAYSIHVHVIAAFFIGGTLSTLGIWHLWKRPAAPLTRHVIAA
ncbi:MAG TPA: histidine kinase, partial [Pirellulaceae bacterium]|nr:histidine kinase [Pirellulaceae bacterium]